MARYKVNVGLNYGPSNKRAEPDDIVTDLPGESIRHLLERGHIEPADADSAIEAPLTKRQLLDVAADLGIDVPARATKDEIEALIADAENTDVFGNGQDGTGGVGAPNEPESEEA